VGGHRPAVDERLLGAVPSAEPRRDRAHAVTSASTFLAQERRTGCRRREGRATPSHDGANAHPDRLNSTDEDYLTLPVELKRQREQHR
jgi:hypothetical protein